MIEYIKVENFKGYRSLTLNFSDALSVLTGQNNAGKTSILEAFLIFQESYSFTLQKLERKARNINLNSGEYNFKESFLISFSSVRSQDYYELFYKNETSFSIEIKFKEKIVQPEKDITIKFEIKKARGGTAYNIISHISSSDLIKLNREYEPKSFFYAIKSSSIYSINQYEPKHSIKMVEKLSLEGKKQSNFRNRLLTLKNLGKLEQLQNSINTIFNWSDFRIYVDFEENSDLYIKVFFSVNDEQKQDIALLGSGTLQIIEVLMSVLLSKNYKNKLILLDEPDSHLHRDIQKNLIKYLRDFSKNGFQILVTTHNEQMITLSKLNELLHLYRSDENIEIKSIGEQIARGRRYGFSNDKKVIYQDLGSSAISMNFIEAIEADKIVIIEGRDKEYIERLENKREAIFPINNLRDKVIFWSLNGVGDLNIKMKRIEAIFELVKNSTNLLSKSILLLDRDYRLDDEMPKFDKLNVLTWKSYTIESLFLENLEILKNYVFSTYIEGKEQKDVFLNKFNSKVDELSNIERYENKISKQREGYKLQKSIEYLQHLRSVSNSFHLLAGKEEFQELLNFINNEFNANIPELENFLINFIDKLDGNTWNSNFNSVLQIIYGS